MIAALCIWGATWGWPKCQMAMVIIVAVAVGCALLRPLAFVFSMPPGEARTVLLPVVMVGYVICSIAALVGLLNLMFARRKS